MYALLFILGLAIGSFLNVVALRYDPYRSVFNFHSIRGRSMCPACHATLRSYDLIPVLSFLLLRAKCRYCRHPISFRYPTVELVTGLIFLLPLYFNNHFGLAHLVAQGGTLVWYYALIVIWTAALLVFLLIALIDLQLYIIPNGLNWTLAALGLARAGFLYWFDKFDLTHGTFLGNYALLSGVREHVFLNVGMGALFGAGMFAVIVAATRGRGMGLGDVKLMAALGLLFGWPDIVLVAIFAFILGALYSIRLLLIGGKSLKDAVPFGPFIVAGATLVIFFGHDLAEWYFNFFQIA